MKKTKPVKRKTAAPAKATGKAVPKKAKPAPKKVAPPVKKSVAKAAKPAAKKPAVKAKAAAKKPVAKPAPKAKAATPAKPTKPAKTVKPKKVVKPVAVKKVAPIPAAKTKAPAKEVPLKEPKVALVKEAPVAKVPKVKPEKLTKAQKAAKAAAAAAPVEIFPALDASVKRPAKPFFLEVKPGVERVIKRGDKSAASPVLDIQARRKGPATEESTEELAARIERELQSQSFLKRNRMRPQLCTKCGINAVAPRFTIDRELGYCDPCAEILHLGETKEARRMEVNLAQKKEEGGLSEDSEEPNPDEVEDVPDED